MAFIRVGFGTKLKRNTDPSQFIRHFKRKTLVLGLYTCVSLKITLMDKFNTFLKPFPFVRKNEDSQKSENEAFPMIDSPQQVASPRNKIPLAPGHSPMDWNKLSNSVSGHRLPLCRITSSELSMHASENDCWMVLQGKVYDITQYVKYHPGGVKQIMKGAGKDGTELFFKVHSWVNADRMLAKFHIGFLISD